MNKLFIFGIGVTFFSVTTLLILIIGSNTNWIYVSNKDGIGLLIALLFNLLVGFLIVVTSNSSK